MTTSSRTKDFVITIWRIAIPVLLAAVLAAVGWAGKKLASVEQDVALVVQQVDGFHSDFEKLRTNVTTALAVLASHSEEFKTMEAEQLRLRTLYDSLNSKVDAQTSDRFTGTDASDLRQWVRDEFTAREKLSELQHQKIEMLIDQLQAECEP